jgi:hypothetical protein
MLYYVEIENREGALSGSVRQEGAQFSQPLPVLELARDSEIEIRDKTYTLGELIDTLVNYEAAELEAVFDERGQLEIGQHLFAQIFGWMNVNERNLLREQAVEVRIVTDDEDVSRLPWVLLADRGIFLSSVGWSVALSPRARFYDVELPPSPKVLVVMPQPDQRSGTDAAAHLEDLEDLLSKADHLHTLNKHLKMVSNWEDFEQQVRDFKPCVIYYYGHGEGDGHSIRLLFAATAADNAAVGIPLVDFANVLRGTPGGAPLLVYVNCCSGDASGYLGAGRQLGSFVSAVITNNTVAEVDAARAQALALWRSILVCGEPPHVAVASLRGSTGRPLAGGVTQTLADVRWMTPVLHCRYDKWTASPPEPPDRLERDPHWRFKLDRLNQFSIVSYDTTGMLSERRPRSLAYIWYGRQRQGVDRFHQRLKIELPGIHRNAFMYEVSPDWPMHLYDPHSSFRRMLETAFGVNNWTQIPARIRTENRGTAGRQTLVAVRHVPVVSINTFDPEKLKTYLSWWNNTFTPMLEQSQAFGLLGISFIVENPIAFKDALDQYIADLDLEFVVIRVLEEMGGLTRRDVSDFLKTHNIRLPQQGRDRIIDKILQQSDGQYEKALEILIALEETHWDLRADEQSPTLGAGGGRFNY